MMDRQALATIIGTMLGSVVEEGLEEIFPGLGELGAAGEVAGGVAGLIAGTLSGDEGTAAANRFLRYAYYRVNGSKLTQGATDEDVEIFERAFRKLPSKVRCDIISSFKNADPQSFHYLRRVLAPE